MGYMSNFRRFTTLVIVVTCLGIACACVWVIFSLNGIEGSRGAYSRPHVSAGSSDRSGISPGTVPVSGNSGPSLPAKPGRPGSVRIRAKLDKYSPKKEAILRKLNSIVIPEMDFSGANLNDVIAELVRLGAKHDTAPHGPDDHAGVAIRVNLDGNRTGDDLPPITFKARNVTLSQTLKVIADMVGVRYKVGDEGVDIVTIELPVEDFVQKMFDADDATVNHAIKVGSRMTGSSTNVDLKSAFEAMGVKWCQGGSITYVPEIQKLVVLNLIDNMDAFEKEFAGIQEQSHPRTIEIR